MRKEHDFICRGIDSDDQRQGLAVSPGWSSHRFNRAVRIFVWEIEGGQLSPPGTTEAHDPSFSISDHNGATPEGFALFSSERELSELARTTITKSPHSFAKSRLTMDPSVLPALEPWFSFSGTLPHGSTGNFSL